MHSMVGVSDVIVAGQGDGTVEGQGDVTVEGQGDGTTAGGLTVEGFDTASDRIVVDSTWTLADATTAFGYGTSTTWNDSYTEWDGTLTYDRTTGELFYDADGGAGTTYSAVLILTLTDKPTTLAPLVFTVP